MSNRSSGNRSGTVGTSGWLQFVADAASWLVALAVTTLALHNFNASRVDAIDALILAAIAILAQAVLGQTTKLYRNRYWTGSLEEAQVVVLVAVVCGVIGTIVAFIFHLGFTIVLMATPIGVCFSMFARYLERRSVDRDHMPAAANARRVFVYGAGDLGRSTVQRMLSDAKSPYYPIGFIDDDATKHNMIVRSVPVLGSGQELADLVREHKIGTIVVAMASPSPTLLNRILTTTADRGVEVKIVPTLERSLGR